MLIASSSQHRPHLLQRPPICQSGFLRIRSTRIKRDERTIDGTRAMRIRQKKWCRNRAKRILSRQPQHRKISTALTNRKKPKRIKNFISHKSRAKLVENPRPGTGRPRIPLLYANDTPLNCALSGALFSTISIQNLHKLLNGSIGSYFSFCATGSLTSFVIQPA